MTFLFGNRIMKGFTWAWAGVAVLVLTAPLQGQQRALELGVDGGIHYTDPAGEGRDNRVWDVAFPLQNLRVGVHVTERVSVEPTISFLRRDLGDDDLTQVGALGNVLYHFTDVGPAMRPQFFGLAGGGLEYVRVSDEVGRDSDTQWMAGGGLGMKLPVADRVSLRTSATYWRAFESDLAPHANMIRGDLGLSLFTR